MQQSSPQTNTDLTANFFWLLAFITIALLAAWWFGKQYITAAIFTVRHYEISAIQFIVDGINSVASFFHFPKINDHTLKTYQYFMAHSSLGAVRFSEVSEISTAVGQWLRWPAIIILVGIAARMFFYHRGARFRTTYNMEHLKKAGQTIWPQITPALHLNLLKEDLDTGPWAMAKLPMDFCKQHELLELTIDAKTNKTIWTIKKNKAERLFTVQMGPLWRGTQGLPIHIKALLVIFLAKIHRKQDVTEQLITQISASAHSTGKLNFSGVEKLFVEYRNSKALHWAETRHAYIGTVMASLLQMTRAEGVLASAEFLWLKPLDRRLWYILNSVGRQTVVVEAAGLFSHWLAEKSLRRPLRVPMVKEAVTALEVAVQDVLYVAEGEKKWHISNAA